MGKEILSFHVPKLDLRGRVGVLSDVVDQILSRHAYPRAIERLLAEGIMLTALVGASFKVMGRFQMQALCTDSAVKMLVVDYSVGERSRAEIRAYARYHADILAHLPEDTDSKTLLGEGTLGLTLEEAQTNARYQGIVALDHHGLEMAFAHYFSQSEQLPTAFKLSVVEEILPQKRHRWHVGGMMIQFMPEAIERLPVRDLPSKARFEDEENEEEGLEDDAWVSARVLLETLGADELVEQGVELSEFVYRLYHEYDPLAGDLVEVLDQCRCSEDKIRLIVESFSEQERKELQNDSQEIEIKCEFCNRNYQLKF